MDEDSKFDENDTTKETTVTVETEKLTSGDWTSKQYADTITKIRHGEWESSKAAITSLRDHIREMAKERDDYRKRIDELLRENTRLMEGYVGDGNGDVVEDTVEERTEVTDIESLWK